MRYVMIVVDRENREHTTFSGIVDPEWVTESMIRSVFRERFGEYRDYYFDWETQWESGDLSVSVDFENG